MRRYRIWTEESFEVGSVIELRGEDVRRVRKVLRLRRGDLVTLVQAGGFEGEAQVLEGSPEKVCLGVTRVWEVNRESPLWIHLSQALSKADKMEWVVQKATELGVQDISVLVTRRCVPQWGPEGSHGRMRRWRRIVQEAARQSGRTFIPSLGGPWDLDGFCREVADRDGLKLVLWEGEKSKGLRDALGRGEASRAMRVILVVGPEGGLEEEEVRQLEGAGFLAVRMGPRILRTETAGPVAVAILQYLFGDLG